MKRVQDEFPEFTRTKVIAESRSYGSQLGFGKASWHTKYDNWPSGFWISNLEFENLLAEHGEAVCGYVWLGIWGDLAFLDNARAKLSRAAERLPKPQKSRWFSKAEDDPRSILWYEVSESRKSIVEMVLNGNRDRFANFILSHAQILTRFTPVLDELFAKRKRR